MKRVLLLLVLSLFWVTTFSQQAYISEELRAHIEKTKDQSLIRINVIFEQQFDILNHKHELIAKKADLHERGVQTVIQLKSFAKREQKYVLEDIQEFNGTFPNSFSNLRKYWAINMISLDASVDLIYHLSLNPDVSLIEYGNSRMVYPIEPVSRKASTMKSPGGIEPGLQAINVPALWEMGYTGRGRKTYNLDTGAWTDHPAIKDRFLGNFYPMNEAFFSLDRDFPKDKPGSHGTHTLGTQLGLDPVTNDTIGAAFNSYYLVADLVATSDATVKPFTDFVYAFEWAMDPDGNPETTDDIPDVINNSWGYLPAEDTELCDGFANDMFIALETVGIAVVFAAGNEGSGPQTIGLPQHLNQNIVNVFTVGSVNVNQEGYPISGFSSRGPTICDGEGAIKIKPEVVAPGEEVRSCVGHEGYEELQGTSMACPHVSGIVLLLKEAFPYLAGSEILEAIYYSAIDLGDEGEDNDYGRGFVDALAAFNYLAENHDPVQPSGYSYDVAISDVVSPLEGLQCKGMFYPEIEITNKGLEPLTSVEVEYYFSNEEVRSFTWEGNLESGASEKVVLDAIYTYSTGNVELYFNLLIDEDEVDEINNKSVVRFNIREELVLPYTEGFDNGSIEELGWTVENSDRYTTWDTVHFESEEYSFESLFMDSWGYSGHFDYLISPLLEFPESGHVVFTFDVAYQHLHDQFTDTLRIYISDECSPYGGEIIYEKGGEELSSNGIVQELFIPGDESQWRTEEIDLSTYVGQGDLLLVFEVYSSLGNRLYVDNINLSYDGEPYFNTEHSALDYELYPNPAKESVLIDVYGENDDVADLKIYDLTGRICKQLKIVSGRQRISVLDLSKGVYLVELQRGSEILSKRLIIE
jgi:bacillopeptidase F